MDMHMTIPSAPFGAAARVRGKAGANIDAEGRRGRGGTVKNLFLRQNRADGIHVRRRLSPALLVALVAAAALAGSAAIAGLSVQAAPAPPPATPAAPAPRSASAPAPVVWEGKTLFTLTARAGAFTPAERAAAITERLTKVAADILVNPVPSLSESEFGTDVVVGRTVLVTVLEADAQTAGLQRRELAASWSAAFAASLAENRDRYSLRSVALGGTQTLLGLLALVLLARWYKRLARRAVEAIDSGRAPFVRPVTAGTMVLASEERVREAMRGAVRVLHLVLLGGAVILWLSLAFATLPWTRGVARRAWDFVADPVWTFASAAIGFLPNIFALALIVVISRYVIRFLKFLFRELGEGRATIAGFEAEWAEPTAKIVSFLVVAFSAVMAFPYLPGSGSDAFKSISLFLGVLFSLASSGAVSNLVAGTLLTYTGAFRLGDRVKIGDQVGDVVEKSLLVTRVRTRRNVEISLPNASVLSGAIVNYSAMARRGGVILSTTVTIGYDAPWRKVHDLLVSAAERTADVLKEPRPFVLQTSLNDFHVSYEINAYITDSRKWDDILSRLHAAIQDAFNEAGVEIMSPGFMALRDGNTVTIPDADKPSGYEAPAFRIR